MAETASVSFETSDLIAALLREVDEIVTLIARPVGWPSRTPAPAEKVPAETGTGWQGRVSPS